MFLLIPHILLACHNSFWCFILHDTFVDDYFVFACLADSQLELFALKIQQDAAARGLSIEHNGEIFLWNDEYHLRGI